MNWRCCACGWGFDHQHEMRAHIEVCDKHPLAFAVASNRALSEALQKSEAALIGCVNINPAIGGMPLISDEYLGACSAIETGRAALAAHGVVPVK